MVRLGALLLFSSAVVLAAAAGCSSDDEENASASPPCTGPGCANVDGGGPEGDGGAAESNAPPLVCPIAKVDVPALMAGGAFGTSIAIDGVVAAVGAPSADSPAGAKGTGTVHLLGREGCVWKHRGATTSNDSSRYDEFGGAVALAAGTLLVGAPGVKEYTASGQTVTTLFGVGAAYAAPVPASGAPAETAYQTLGGLLREGLQFGAAVALSPDAKTALMGAPGYGYFNGISEVTSMGVVWLMPQSPTGYTPTEMLYGPDKDAVAGSAIGFGDGIVLSGAPGFDRGAGKVHVYTNAPDGDGGAAWTRADGFRAQAPVAGSRFGATIAFAGNLAVVGAPDYKEGDAGAAAAGAAYVFVRGADGAWTEAQKLVPSDLGEKDHFGHAIAVNSELIVIGAPNELYGATKAGAVYVFEKKAEGFVQKTKLLSPETAAGDAFGAALAMAGGVVLAGAPTAANGTGAVFSFTP